MRINYSLESFTMKQRTSRLNSKLFSRELSGPRSSSFDFGRYYEPRS